MNDIIISTKTRLASMLLDHVIICIFAAFFSIPAMISMMSNFSNNTKHKLEVFEGYPYLMMIGFSVYFCKDCINGRSVAKPKLGLQVVNNSTGQVASPLQCFFRDIFCIIWPIEIVVTFFNPNRRIGDFVAGTKVVRFDPLVSQPKPNFFLVGVLWIISYCLFCLLLKYG